MRPQDTKLAVDASLALFGRHEPRAIYAFMLGRRATETNALTATHLGCWLYSSNGAEYYTNNPVHKPSFGVIPDFTFFLDGEDLDGQVVSIAITGKYGMVVSGSVVYDPQAEDFELAWVVKYGDVNVRRKGETK